MYSIKRSPEDFIVKELLDISPKESGQYAICTLKKRNYTSQRAIEAISKTISKSIKDISFAGNKDKYAVTEQFISIRNIGKREFPIILKDLELRFLGFSAEPIFLGSNIGNEFEIAVRDVSAGEQESLEKNMADKRVLMPNYYGEQRFSKKNSEIGKLLLKNDYKTAIKLIIETSDYANMVDQFLEIHPGSYIPALRIIPKKLLQMYIHAFQSELWNQLLDEYLKTSAENTGLPVIGFGTEISDERILALVEKIMEKENIIPRSFINRQLPELSSEGGIRQAFVEIQDLKVLEKKADYIKLNFKLVKGSYATEAIRFLLSKR